jgi:hypothetical protein
MKINDIKKVLEDNKTTSKAIKALEDKKAPWEVALNLTLLSKEQSDKHLEEVRKEFCKKNIKPLLVPLKDAFSKKIGENNE